MVKERGTFLEVTSENFEKPSFRLATYNLDSNLDTFNFIGSLRQKNQRFCKTVVLSFKLTLPPTTLVCREGHRVELPEGTPRVDLPRISIEKTNPGLLFPLTPLYHD